MSIDSPPDRIVVKCADHLQEVWKSNLPGRAQLPLLLLALVGGALSGRWHWLGIIPVAALIILGVRSLLTIQRASWTFPCPVCRGTANLVMGRPIQLECPTCGKTYPTDATLPLAGNRPEKIPSNIGWSDTWKK